MATAAPRPAGPRPRRTAARAARLVPPAEGSTRGATAARAARAIPGGDPGPRPRCAAPGSRSRAARGGLRQPQATTAPPRIRRRPPRVPSPRAARHARGRARPGWRARVRARRSCAPGVAGARAVTASAASARPVERRPHDERQSRGPAHRHGVRRSQEQRPAPQVGPPVDQGRGLDRTRDAEAGQLHPGEDGKHRQGAGDGAQVRAQQRRDEPERRHREGRADRGALGQPGAEQARQRGARDRDALGAEQPRDRRTPRPEADATAQGEQRAADQQPGAVPGEPVEPGQAGGPRGEQVEGEHGRDDQPEGLRSSAQARPGQGHGPARQGAGHHEQHQRAAGQAQRTPGDRHEDDRRDQQAQRAEGEQHHGHRERGKATRPPGPRRLTAPCRCRDRRRWHRGWHRGTGAERSSSTSSSALSMVSHSR